MTAGASWWRGVSGRDWRVLATAQGLCYNVGRAASALAPITIGALADGYGIGPALGLTLAFFAASALLVLSLPETRATALS